MDDPRTDLEAFAVLIARIADPYTVEAVMLAAHGLDLQGFAQLTAAWSARLAGDGTLASRFERAFEAAKVRSPTATGPEPQPTEETLFVQPDAAARAALLAPPLPFREGTFVPAPSDRAPRERAGSSIDETLLPYETPGVALPFSPKTDREGEPR